MSDTTIKHKPRPAPVKQVDEAKEKAKEKERKNKEEEKNRKSHNSIIRDKINKLLKNKETLQLESYAKARALSNPHFYRDEETAKEYGRRMKEIEKLIQDIEAGIKALESQII